MAETEQFVNEGFGWECKRCRESGGEAAAQGGGAGDYRPAAAQALARFFREGEAEGGSPHLSSTSLARWKDETRRTLSCPVCGVEEEVES